jgi:hypothetical protein
MPLTLILRSRRPGACPSCSFLFSLRQVCNSWIFIVDEVLKPAYDLRWGVWVG